MNRIARLEFELAYEKITIQHFSHYDTGNLRSDIDRYIDRYEQRDIDMLNPARNIGIKK